MAPFAARVSEEGLAGGNRDTIGNQDTTNLASVSGSVPLGGVVDVSLLVFALTAPLATITSGGEAITWSGDGTSTLIGSANGGEVVRVSIDATGTWTVTLSDSIDHLGSGEGELAMVFGVSAGYVGGVPVTSILTVTVEDDAPVAAITDGVASNTAGTEVNGTLMLGGADIPSGVVLSGTPPQGLTSLGQAVEYTQNGSTLTASAGGETVFTLIANSDGTYTFELLRPLDLATLTADFTSNTTSPGGPGTYFLFEDGTFDGGEPDRPWAVRITGTSEDGTAGGVNPSTQGMGVDNNWLDVGESILFEFDDEAASGDPNLTYFARIGVNFIDEDESMNYTVHYSDGSSMTINGATLVDGNLEIGAPAGLYLDSIEVSVDGPPHHSAVRLTSLATFSRDDSQPLALDFGFTGTDADGDGIAGDFTITLQNSALLEGGSGDDALGGGDGSERLHGGAGNDILTGGFGADIFAWEIGDQGTVEEPAVDHITDFSMADTDAGGDALDLADLLLGVTGDNIGNYLGFEKSGDDTIVHVSTTGDLDAGADQLIVLQGVDLTTLGDDNAIIADLLNRGKLIID